ncbi:MAG: hypothetical protein L6Q81_05335 [Bacteroidia bacterium]|nr:hypothetical protein [Bacteroidia bacterium]
MNIQSITVFALCLLGFSCSDKGDNNPEACNGDTRREVKLMIDDRNILVDTVPEWTTIEALGALEVPDDVKSETARLDLELKSYAVRAYVEEVDRKHDGDYHILLKSGEEYLICEVPNPDCDYAESAFMREKYRSVVSFIESNELEGQYVYITGVAFVDIDHHYARKQADNNLELHPVFDIHF